MITMNRSSKRNSSIDFKTKGTITERGSEIRDLRVKCRKNMWGNLNNMRQYNFQYVKFKMTEWH